MEQPCVRQKSPHIPPELWLKIFAMATSFPGAIDPAPPYRVDASPHRLGWPNERETEETDATKLKLALVLVCRSWWQMTMEVLYEIVSLRQRASPQGATHVKALLRTLNASAGANCIKKYGRKKCGRQKRVKGVEGTAVVDGAGMSDHV